MPLSLTNAEVHVIINHRSLAQSWYALSLRASGGWVQASGSPGANTILPENGYVFRYQGVDNASSNNVLRRVVSGSSTNLLTNVAIEDGIVAHHERNIKLRMDGSTLGVKSWITGSSEPAYTEVTGETQFTGAGEIRFGVSTNTATMTSTSHGGSEGRPHIRRVTVTNLDTDTVVFDDEFIGTAGDPVDATKWTTDIAASSDIVIFSNETSAAVTIGANNDHVRLTTLDQSAAGVAVSDDYDTSLTVQSPASVQDDYDTSIGVTTTLSDDYDTSIAVQEPGLSVPGNVSVTINSRTSATVTWDDVASADVFQVEARVRAGSA